MNHSACCTQTSHLSDPVKGSREIFNRQEYRDSSIQRTLDSQGIRKVVAGIVDDMQRTGEPVPPAIAGKNYSGKFMVRIPPEVHRKLAIQAAESGVSLNRLASSKLSQ